MRTLHGVAALLALSVLLGGCASSPAAPAFDHYDPVKLRAAAAEREAAGDSATANVLRARAARLVPHEMRAAPASPAAAAPAAPPAPLPEPPALWPAK